MRFEICRASNNMFDEPQPCDGALSSKEPGDGYRIWTIEVETLADLVALSKNLKQSLVLRAVGSAGSDPKLTIYDSWLE